MTETPTTDQSLGSALREAGFAIEVVSGADALRALRPGHHVLVLIDTGKLSLSGPELCRALRDRSGRIPIIVVVATNDEAEAVEALEAGADDCITTPLRLRELVARARAAVRRAPALEQGTAVLEVGDVRLDAGGFGVAVRGVPVELTRKEFELLALLMENAGQILTRGTLIDRVWGPDANEGKTLDTHIRRLRLKIEDDPSNPTRIVTVRGVGYRYQRPSR